MGHRLKPKLSMEKQEFCFGQNAIASYEFRLSGMLLQPLIVDAMIDRNGLAGSDDRVAGITPVEPAGLGRQEQPARRFQISDNIVEESCGGSPVH